METFTANLKKFLNDDQVLMLQCANPALNTRRWSEETIRKGVRILCKVHVAGYDYLRLEEHFPLPAYTTIFQRISHITFEPGITPEMIQWLRTRHPMLISVF